MLTGYQVSSHLINERAERVAAIGQIFGFGEILYRFKATNSYGNKVEAVTSTGILVVFSEKEKLIITMYPATIDKLCGLFHGEVPADLRRIVTRNMKNASWKRCM